MRRLIDFCLTSNLNKDEAENSYTNFIHDQGMAFNVRITSDENRLNLKKLIDMKRTLLPKISTRRNFATHSVFQSIFCPLYICLGILLYFSPEKHTQVESGFSVYQ